jgi:hypothetical protein
MNFSLFACWFREERQGFLDALDNLHHFSAAWLLLFCEAEPSENEAILRDAAWEHVTHFLGEIMAVKGIPIVQTVSLLDTVAWIEALLTG